MITKLEACGYRCLREVRRPLLPCQVLVGPNGSGKSAFLDAIAFLGDVVSKGLREAIELRTDNFYDLVWGRRGEFVFAGAGGARRRGFGGHTVRGGVPD